MASPRKRAKTARADTPASRRALSSPSKQPSLHDLFAKSSACEGRRSSAQQFTQTLSNQRNEDQELELAIQASLREAEAVAAAAAPSKEEGDEELRYDRSACALPADDGNTEHEDRQAPVMMSEADHQCAQPLRPSDINVGPPHASVKEEAGRGEHEDGSARPASFLKEYEADVESKPQTRNAFAKLMTSHSEAKEWANADAVEGRNYAGKAKSRPQQRVAPFYKVLTGMPISVDAFRFGEIKGCNAYFLSHFHADHYGGLTSGWTHGPIYCSQTTANLVRTSLYVNEMHICPIPMNTPTVIPRTGGVRVTLLDANHCPGSCLFLFEGPQTQHILPTPAGTPHPALPPPHVTFRYLHCGDFRASPRHSNHPLIKGKRLDIIYLDTTYCNPRYCFPAQEMVVAACAERVRQLAPEQCAEGQRRIAEGLLEPEEDWRRAPLTGKALEAAREATRQRRAGAAMQDWLNKRGIVYDAADAKQEPQDMANVKEEDDEAFGDLDFRDEEAAFRVESRGVSASMSAEPEQAKDEDEQYGGVRVKDEPLSEDDDGAQEDGLPAVAVKNPQECHDGDAPALPVDVKEEPALDLLEMDERSGLGQDPHSGQLKSDATGAQGAAPFKTEDDYPRVLVVVGTYTIGKEKVVLGCARALGTKIYCADKRKYRVYAQLEDAELHSLLTRDPRKAYVHVTSLMTINGDALKEHTSRMRAEGMRIDRAVAFRPTGWTYRPPAGMDVISPSLERLIQWNQQRIFTAAQLFPTRDSSPQYSIYGVPYSEHSSFFELTAFCLSVDYGRIVATVNIGNPNSRSKMARWFEKWKAEKKRRENAPVDARSLDYY